MLGVGGRCDENRMGLDHSNVPWDGLVYADVLVVGAIMGNKEAVLRLLQLVLGHSHSLYEKGDHCVEIDLATLDKVRDFLVRYEWDYDYEAENWKEYHMVEVTCVKCGASKIEPQSHDMHFLVDGLCPDCDEKAGHP